MLPSFATGSPLSDWNTGIFSAFARSTWARIVDEGLAGDEDGIRMLVDGLTQRLRWVLRAGALRNNADRPADCRRRVGEALVGLQRDRLRALREAIFLPVGGFFSAVA